MQQGVIRFLSIVKNKKIPVLLIANPSAELKYDRDEVWRSCAGDVCNMQGYKNK